MSAFIVNDYHINALVTWAVHNKVSYYTKAFGRVGINDGTAQAVASALLRENVRSVNYRYSERNRSRIKYQAVDVSNLSPADIVRACDCLDYQSCERDDWKRSEAYAILQAIRNDAVCELTRGTNTWELRQPLQEAA